jgi:hypothetical protein
MAAVEFGDDILQRARSRGAASTIAGRDHYVPRTSVFGKDRSDCR